MKKSLVVSQKHTDSNSTDDEESHDRKGEDILDDTPESRNQSCCKDKKYIHRHTKRKWYRHELYFCIGVQEGCVFFSLSELYVFSYLLTEEDDMPYPEYHHRYIGNDDHHLEVDIPTRECCHDSLICWDRSSRVLGDEHEIHEKTHRESTCTECVEEVEWLEWMTKSYHRDDIKKLNTYIL